MLFNQLQNRLSNMIGCTVFNKVTMPRNMKTSYILKHQNSLKHPTFKNEGSIFYILKLIKF